MFTFHCILALAIAGVTLAVPPAPDYFKRDSADPCSVDPTGYKHDDLKVPDVIGNFGKLNSSLAAKPSWNNGTQTANDPALLTWNYNIDCKTFPNICENWCFYAYCKTKDPKITNPWIVHIDRAAGNRARSDCKTPNKCSHTCKGRGGWSLNPNTNWECDEQPKNTNTEGGPGAATRCMTKEENGSEGNAWKSFINQSGTKNPPLPNTQQVTVVLNNVNGKGLCASYGTGTTTCPVAITPQSPGVPQKDPKKFGTDNGIRQA